MGGCFSQHGAGALALQDRLLLDDAHGARDPDLCRCLVHGTSAHAPHRDAGHRLVGELWAVPHEGAFGAFCQEMLRLSLFAN